jgi:hypothetical protein
MTIHPRIKETYILSQDFRSGYKLKNQADWGTWQFEHHSALTEALKGTNDAIIEMIIHAYTDSERLYQDYTLVYEAKNPAVMRAWIERLQTLTSGVSQQIPDDIVTLFLSTTIEQAIQDHDIQSLKLLHTYGLKISENAFTLALKAQDRQMLDYFLSEGNFVGNFDSYEQLLACGFNDIVEQHLSDKAYEASAKHNRADLFTLGIQNGFEPNSNHLLIAIEHGSMDVVTLLCMHGVDLEGALLCAVTHRQHAVVKLLLSLDISYEELVKAKSLAYDTHAYELFDAIDQALHERTLKGV